MTMTPVRGRVYAPIEVATPPRGSSQLAVCPDCGVLVVSIPWHDRWHDETSAAPDPAPTILRSVKELEELPNHAVVYDHDNQVWQRHTSHPFSTMSHCGPAWYPPGSEVSFEADEIALPARLLNDGL